MNWDASEIRSLIRLALQEDKTRDDITTRTLIRRRWRVVAEVRAKENGVIAGLPLAARFFQAMDRRCVVSWLRRDGDSVRRGETLMRVKGNARAILSAERPALNALQHLSGIATFTANQVRRLRGAPTRLFDTRKTLPAWRLLQKYAVRCGGGTNHRMSLAEAMLIKDNHLRICRLAKAPWTEAIKRLRGRRPLVVQVEIQGQRDLQDAMDLKPQMVLLDNMPVPRLRKAIRELRRAIPGAHVEVSGGVKPQQLRTLARLGVERISMGQLTHSAPAFDCSLDIVHVDTH